MIKANIQCSKCTDTQEVTANEAFFAANAGRQINLTIPRRWKILSVTADEGNFKTWLLCEGCSVKTANFIHAQ